MTGWRNARDKVRVALSPESSPREGRDLLGRDLLERRPRLGGDDKRPSALAHGTGRQEVPKFLIPLRNSPVPKLLLAFCLILLTACSSASSKTSSVTSGRLTFVVSRKLSNDANMPIWNDMLNRSDP